MAIRTIFSMAEDCSHGVRQGWYEFVRDYAPIAQTLLAHYFPSLVPDLSSAVTEVFVRAHADDNAWFRSLHFVNEREFAMPFRDLVFTAGRSSARLPAPNIPPDDIFALRQDLTLIQQQLFWAFLKGWDVQQSSAMLMNASATAQETNALTAEKLPQLSPHATVERTSVALVAIEAAQSRKTSDCPPWKVFNNLINGQISWREREDAELHMSRCVHCLDAFTAFQEMIWLEKNRQTAAMPEVEQVLQKLNFRAAPSKGLLGRLFSRAS